MEILNPYDGAFARRWYKGDLHIHTSASDGRADTAQVLARLRECGHDFAAIADHDLHTPGDDASDPVLLPNCEFNTPHGDILSLFAEVERPENGVPQQIIDAINDAGGFPVIAHPKLREFSHDAAERAVTSANLIRDLSGYAAIEVYTHNIGSGFQVAIDRLDAVWTWRIREGRTPVGLWGIACSDSHDPHTITPDVGIMVAAEECTQKALRSAIERGAFYSLAASPARFREIQAQGRTVHVVADRAETLQLYGVPQADFTGERRRLAIAWADGRGVAQIDYEVTGAEGFIRAEAMDRAGNLIYANPIEIRADAPEA